MVNVGFLILREVTSISTKINKQFNCLITAMRICIKCVLNDKLQSAHAFFSFPVNVESEMDKLFDNLTGATLVLSRQTPVVGEAPASESRLNYLLFTKWQMGEDTLLNSAFFHL